MPRPGHSWKVPLAMSIFVMVVVIALATGNGTIDGAAWRAARDAAATIAARLSYYIGPALLLIAFLHGHRHAPRLLTACLIGIAVNAATIVFRAFTPPTDFLDRSVLQFAMDIMQVLSNPVRLVPLLLMSAGR